MARRVCSRPPMSLRRKTTSLEQILKMDRVTSICKMGYGQSTCRRRSETVVGYNIGKKRWYEQNMKCDESARCFE